VDGDGTMSECGCVSTRYVGAVELFAKSNSGRVGDLADEDVGKEGSDTISLVSDALRDLRWPLLQRLKKPEALVFSWVFIEITWLLLAIGNLEGKEELAEELDAVVGLERLPKLISWVRVACTGLRTGLADDDVGTEGVVDEH
jgi:hypothetical protein